MRTTVGRIYRFRATHSLPGYGKPWCHPHQHDYTVEVVAEGGTPTDLLDSRWREAAQHMGLHLEPDLNTFFKPSTVEAIAGKLLGSFEDKAISVTVWEDRQRWGKAER